MEQSLEPERGHPRPVEHLAVAQPHRRPAIDRRIQVTVEVPVALGRGVVEQAAVELHEEGVVLDVAVDDPEVAVARRWRSARGRP